MDAVQLAAELNREVLPRGMQEQAPGGGQDRSYRVNSFQLLGPFDVKGLSSTPSRDRILICNPATDKTKTPEACAKEIFSTLAKRAYRRPVTNEDISELMQYYADGVKNAKSKRNYLSVATAMHWYRGEHEAARARGHVA